MKDAIKIDFDTLSGLKDSLSSLCVQIPTPVIITGANSGNMASEVKEFVKAINETEQMLKKVCYSTKHAMEIVEDDFAQAESILSNLINSI